MQWLFNRQIWWNIVVLYSKSSWKQRCWTEEGWWWCCLITRLVWSVLFLFTLQDGDAPSASTGGSQLLIDTVAPLTAIGSVCYFVVFLRTIRVW